MKNFKNSFNNIFSLSCWLVRHLSGSVILRLDRSIQKQLDSVPRLDRGIKSGNDNRLLFLFLLPLVLFLWTSYASAAIPIEVTLGKETILTLKQPSDRISLASPDIVDIKLISPTEIVINGKKPGITSLIIWDSEGRKFYDVVVRVPKAEIPQCDQIDLLEKYIKEISPDSDVKAECEGDVLILKGTIRNRYSCKREKEAIIQSVDLKAAITTQTTEEREVCDETSRRIELIAKLYAPGNFKILNLITITDTQQVILEVRVAQIDKSKLKDLGISALTKQRTWELTAPSLFATPSGTVGGLSSAGGTAPGQVSGGSQGTSGKVSPGIGSFDVGSLAPQIGVAYFPGGVAVVLKALAEKDYAKVLAEPNLVVRSGEDGRFFVGTRVPIQTVTGAGASATPSITFEQVGITLNFKPRVLETGVIRLGIDPAEVANITRFLTLSGIIAPEIDSRRVSTSVDLNDGESLVIAGLLSDEMKKSIQKMPIFGDIPILGAIFRSTHDEITQKELAFFITPHLVKPIPAGVKTTLPEERQLPPGDEREFEWVPLPPRASENIFEEKRTTATSALTTMPGAGMSIDKEVNIFIDQYTHAYEYGDAERFMSLYSRSAVENNMNYDDISRAYQRNFAGGKYTYVVSNLKTYKTDGKVVLTAAYRIKKIEEGGAGPVTEGNITWTLVHEDGGLRIVRVEY